MWKSISDLFAGAAPLLKTPYEIMDSEEGALKVAMLIFRIEQGVYS